MPLVGLKGGGFTGQDSTAISTTMMHSLGSIAIDSSGGEYIYLQGSTAASTMAAGDWVSIHSTAGGSASPFQMSRLVAAAAYSTARIFLAISMSTNGSTAAYSWAQISGRSTIAHLGSTTEAPLAKLNLSAATAGALTTSSGGAPVFNAMTLSSGASSLCEVWINYPFVSTKASS